MVKATTLSARDEASAHQFFQGSTALSRVLREVSCLSWDWGTEPRPDASVHLRQDLFLNLCVKLAYLRLRPNKVDIGKSRTFSTKVTKGVCGSISKGRTVIE